MNNLKLSIISFYSERYLYKLSKKKKKKVAIMTFSDQTKTYTQLIK